MKFFFFCIFATINFAHCERKVVGRRRRSVIGSVFGESAESSWVQLALIFCFRYLLWLLNDEPKLSVSTVILAK